MARRITGRNLKMNHLVTGGAGFIGSHYVKEIMARGDQAVILDSLTYAGNLDNLFPLMDEDNIFVCSTNRTLAEVVLHSSGSVVCSHPQSVNEGIAEKLKNHKVRTIEIGDVQRFLQDSIDSSGVALIRGDVCDSSLLAELMGLTDVVVNFAAETHVDRSILNPSGFIKTDVYGTFNLLECARKTTGLKKFVHISTDEVYGPAPEGVSFKEDDPINPRNPYSASKAAADRLVFAYNQTYGLPTNIIRPSNNFGPFQYPEKLIPVMILKALSNERLPVYGEGKQIRDWLFVGDNVKAIDLVVKGGESGEVYNVSGRNEKSNVEVVLRILDCLGKDHSLVKFVKDRPGHDYRYSIDDSKIRTKLGYHGESSFEKNLEKTIDWYLQNTGWWESILREDSQYRDFMSKWYEDRK